MRRKASLLLFVLISFFYISAIDVHYKHYYTADGSKHYLKHDTSVAALINFSGIDQSLFSKYFGESLIDPISSFKGKIKTFSLKTTESADSWDLLKNILAKRGVYFLPVMIEKSGRMKISDGSIGVEFKEHISFERKQQILDKMEIKAVEINSNEPNYIHVTIKEGADPFEISCRLFESGYVKWAEPNLYSEYKPTSTPNDPYYPNQWHLSQISASSAWDIETGDSSVKIGIVDSGVETAHPDLNCTAGYDFLSGDSNPNPDIAHDDHYGVPHGTSVAGIAAAKTNNSLGVAGVCQNCTVIPIRLIGGYISSFDIKNALQYAVDQGAWVVNNSWGPSNESCVNVSASSYQASAVEYGKVNGRGGKGTIMVWAAGNDNCDTYKDGDLRNKDIVVVSAITSSGGFASYSNYGDEVDVSAGAASYTTDIAGGYGYNYLSGTSDGDGLSNLDYTSVFSGTSAAAPVVAGSIALMLAANPELTFSGAMNCLKSTAKKTTKTCSHGSWELQNDIYLESGSKEHSPCFGFGTVDVNLMVIGAINGTCGTCIQTADIDLCYGGGVGVDDDCNAGIDDNCLSGGNGKAGDPCTGNSFCANTGNDFFCKTGWPDGYCSGNCVSNGDCYGVDISVCKNSECRAVCVSSAGIRDGYKCEDGVVVPGIPDPEPFCGDNIVEGDEECDDGNSVSGDGCSFICKLEPECVPDEMECRSTALFWCKEGFWKLVRDCAADGEVCVENLTAALCDSTIVCGNNFIETGEQCDDGNNVTEKCPYGVESCTVCASNCTYKPGITEYCGDNIKNGDEECDDGNRNAGDGCDANCKIEIECGTDEMECRGSNLYWCNSGLWQFVKDCTPLGKICEQNGITAVCKTEEIPDTVVTPDELIIPDEHIIPDEQVIPDEHIIPDEQIMPDEDDAVADLENPDMSNDTEIAIDNEISDNEQPDENIREYCGNGKVEAGEQCDDGNNIPGDGCDPLCNEEVIPDEDTQVYPDVDNNQPVSDESNEQADLENEQEQIHDDEKTDIINNKNGCSVIVI